MIKYLLSFILSFITLFSFGQQSMNMTELSQYYPSNVVPGNPEQFNEIWGYVAPNNSEYAIFGSISGTYFIDVSDPLNPVEIDYFPGGGTGVWRDFETYNNYAFGVADVTSGNSLQIFDLQYLPDSVVKVYDNDTFSSNCHNIHIDNDRLYLISNTRGGNYYPLDILDITSPLNPVLIGGIRNGVNVAGNYSTSHDAYVKNDTVYLSVYFNGSGNNGLHVFDLTNPMTPQLLGSIQNYPGAGINHASWMNPEGTHLIMADETLTSPLKMVDIQNLDNIQAVSTFAPNPGAIAHNPFIKDSLAYISYYHEGVQIYDVSEPANPFRVGYFDTDTTIGNGNYSPNYRGCWGVYPFLPSGNILASDRKNGLFVLTYDGATTTSLERVSQNLDIKVYPNPTKGLFTISNENNFIQKISLSNINGKVLFQKEIQKNTISIEINIQEESNGIYILKAIGEVGETQYKLFKE